MEFANAVDCMMSYFYEANYDASKYDTAEPLVHAQVAIIADKYNCASLYKLARTFFANTAENFKNDDWADIATLVYNYTTRTHADLRGLVIAAVAGRRSVLDSILRIEKVEELLRSDADLATDLLLGGMHIFKVEDKVTYIFICSRCRYAHAGSPDCSKVAPEIGVGMYCVQCEKGPDPASRRCMYAVDMYPASSCPSCDGYHTVARKESEFAREPQYVREESYSI